MYLSVYMCTRPDIAGAYAVGTLARYSSKPGRSHWTAVKRVVRYLKGTAIKPWNRFQRRSIWKHCGLLWCRLGGWPRGQKVHIWISISDCRRAHFLAKQEARHCCAVYCRGGVCCSVQCCPRNCLAEEVDLGTEEPTWWSYNYLGDNQSAMAMAKNPGGRNISISDTTSSGSVWTTEKLNLRTAQLKKWWQI